MRVRWRAWGLVGLVLGTSLPLAAQKTSKTEPQLLLRRLTAAAEACCARGNYPAAEAPLQQALTAAETAWGQTHAQTLEAANRLAGLYQTLGRYREAAALYRRVLKAREETQGPSAPVTAGTLSDLAAVYVALGRYREAEPLLQCALLIHVGRYGRDHPETAPCLNNLAWLYQTQGRYSEADTLFQRALSINESALGPDDLATATSLNNLACLYTTVGRTAEAQPLLERALAIHEVRQGRWHPATAACLANLASVLSTAGQYSAAEAALQRVVAIYEQAFGPEHPDVAAALNNLASIYYGQGRAVEALPALERALRLNEQALGPRHPAVAATLGNLSRLQATLGHYPEAEILAQRALALREQVLGADHLLTASSLRHLADAQAARGQPEAALAALRRGVRIENRLAGGLFGSCTRRQREEFSALLADSADDLLTLCVTGAPTSPAFRSAGLELLLARQCWLLEAETRQVRASRMAGDPHCAATLAELTTVRDELARMALEAPRPEQQTAYRRQWELLLAQQETLEARLVRQSRELSAQAARQEVAPAAVAAVLPPGATLIEFASYRPRRYTAPVGEPRWGAQEYVAFVLRAGAHTPECVPLGAAGPVNRALARYRRALEARRDPRTLEMTARGLWHLVGQPLESFLLQARRVYVVPDGELHLLPFAALEMDTPNGRRFLGERVEVCLLNSGRDLLPRANASAAGALVLGAPDYGKLATAADAPAAAPAPSATVLPAGLQGLQLPPLPGAQREADAVALALRKSGLKTQFLTGAAATEESLKTMTAPRVLHLATHGFFVPAPAVGDRTPDPETPLQDPLHRSALALAGAQQTLAGLPPAGRREDGLLMAAEVAGLDLQGTALVVLSACETGVGEVQLGEGVMGLRWAFAAAGARDLVMSLWAVPDEPTQALMVDFYRRWLQSGDSVAALTGAQRALLKRQRAGGEYAPWQWAGFTVCRTATPPQSGPTPPSQTGSRQ